MDEFLRWLGAIGLPFVSFGLGFSAGLLLTAPETDAKRQRGTLIVSSAAVFMCAIQLVSEPVIQPIWLQYALLFGVPALFGLGILVRPRRRADRGNID